MMLCSTAPIDHPKLTVINNNIYSFKKNEKLELGSLTGELSRELVNSMQIMLYFGCDTGLSDWFRPEEVKSVSG